MKRKSLGLLSITLFVCVALFPGEYAKAASLPKECQSVSRAHLPEPKIFIYKINKSGGTARAVYRVSGTIEGSCLTEVGYFRRGHLHKKIPIEVSRDFTRSDFSVEVDLSDYPEIRAYNSAGASDIYPVYIGNSSLQYEQPATSPTSKYATKRDDYYATGPVDPKTRRKQIFGW